MEDYRPNSKKSKAEARESKKIEPVAKCKTTKKKTGLRKLIDNFISEDIGSVKDYILLDVLIPAAKKTISEMVTNGIDMILWGEAGHSKRSSNSVSYISYNKYSDKKDTYTSRTRNGYDYDDIVLETRTEAEEVLTRMDELIATYGVVSVADMYDLVGMTCNYTDNKYGWTNIRNAEPIRVRDGYLLKMPKAGPID